MTGLLTTMRLGENAILAGWIVIGTDNGAITTPVLTNVQVNVSVEPLLPTGYTRFPVAVVVPALMVTENEAAGVP